MRSGPFIPAHMPARSKYRRPTLAILATLVSFITVACQNDGRVPPQASAVPVDGPAAPMAPGSVSASASAAGAPGSGSDCIGPCVAPQTAREASAAGSGGSAPAAGAPAAKGAEPGKGEPAMSPGSARVSASMDPDAELDCAECSERMASPARTTRRRHGRLARTILLLLRWPLGQGSSGRTGGRALGTKGIVHHVLLYSLQHCAHERSSEAYRLARRRHADHRPGARALASDTGSRSKRRGQGFLLPRCTTSIPASRRSTAAACVYVPRRSIVRARPRSLARLGADRSGPGRTGTAKGAALRCVRSQCERAIEITCSRSHESSVGAARR